MPIFVLNTNLPRNKIPAGFNSDATDLIGRLLGKDKYVMVVLIFPVLKSACFCMSVPELRLQRIPLSMR